MANNCLAEEVSSVLPPRFLVEERRLNGIVKEFVCGGGASVELSKGGKYKCLTPR